ncbi:MAG: hypothetical protein CMF80_07810 [Candidatus Marinimicrobia bacterium]|nr:hypothetical protein [Candidatus Neomarinimicrobiota bacterium]|tara:strand:- start:672 stop:1604 length:933 start_codon:yes stop_codon:yes gene_type:complete
MDSKEMLIVITSLIIAIIALLVYNTAMDSYDDDIVWPPVTRNCPDGWKEGSQPGYCYVDPSNVRIIDKLDENGCTGYSFGVPEYDIDKFGVDDYFDLSDNKGETITKGTKEKFTYAYFDPNISNNYKEKEKRAKWLLKCDMEWEGVEKKYSEEPDRDREEKQKKRNKKNSILFSVGISLILPFILYFILLMIRPSDTATGIPSFTLPMEIVIVMLLIGYLFFGHLIYFLFQQVILKHDYKPFPSLGFSFGLPVAVVFIILFLFYNRKEIISGVVKFLRNLRVVIPIILVVAVAVTVVYLLKREGYGRGNS